MRASGTRPTSASGHERSQRPQRRQPRPDKPIMVVEDDTDLRDALEYLLRSCGYQVVPARDGEEALAQLRDGLVPCLILLDLLMPRKDGFQFRSEQMQTPAFAKIPTIAYSGIYAGSTLREKANALGIDTVLDKPVDYDGLLDIVERYCPRS